MERLEERWREFFGGMSECAAEDKEQFMSPIERNVRDLLCESGLE
jgi:hypothetical protein